MKTKKANEIFGYGLYVVGALKIILVVLVLLKLASNLNAISSGNDVNSDYYPTFSKIIGTTQLMLAVGSIIMIIINIGKQPEVIGGYLLGIGALALEFVTPPIMSFYVVFIECGMYMKAGNKILKEGYRNESGQRTTKKMIKDTDWFYADEKEIK